MMRNALIVGGSRGLGLGLVREHLGRGWRVTATVRTRSVELDELRQGSAGRLAVEALDVTDPGQAAALAQRLGGQTFDLLFLNAGMMAGRGVALGEVPDSDVVSIFLTNAIGPIRVADALLGSVAPGGTIAFMSSILGSIGTNDDGRATPRQNSPCWPSIPAWCAHPWEVRARPSMSRRACAALPTSSRHAGARAGRRSSTTGTRSSPGDLDADALRSSKVPSRGSAILRA